MSQADLKSLLENQLAEKTVFTTSGIARLHIEEAIRLSEDIQNAALALTLAGAADQLLIEHLGFENKLPAAKAFIELFRTLKQDLPVQLLLKAIARPRSSTKHAKRTGEITIRPAQVDIQICLAILNFFIATALLTEPMTAFLTCLPTKPRWRSITEHVQTLDSKSQSSQISEMLEEIGRIFRSSKN